MFWNKKPKVKHPLIRSENASFIKINDGEILQDRRLELYDIFQKFSENGFKGLNLWQDCESQKQYYLYYPKLNNIEIQFLIEYIELILRNRNWTKHSVFNSCGRICIYIYRPTGR